MLTTASDFSLDMFSGEGYNNISTTIKQSQSMVDEKFEHRNHPREWEPQITQTLLVAANDTQRHSPHMTIKDECQDESANDSADDNSEGGEVGSDRPEAVHYEERESQYDSRYYFVLSDRTSIRTFHTTRSRQTDSSRNSAASALTRTAWRQTLFAKNLILPKFDETNWSGCGQHIEFTQDDTAMIDDLLIPMGVLGHSATALVERVRCKRIILARKKIRCNWRLKREDAIEEVAHLQRLRHAHIIRGVGTYVMAKTCPSCYIQRQRTILKHLWTSMPIYQNDTRYYPPNTKLTSGFERDYEGPSNVS